MTTEEILQKMRAAWRLSSAAPTAIHEAAHVTVAHRCGIVPTFVTIEGNAIQKGHCAWNWDVPDWRILVRAVLAGVVAEYVTTTHTRYGHDPVEASEDLKIARRQLERHSYDRRADEAALLDEAGLLVHSNWAAIESLAAELVVEKTLSGEALTNAIARACRPVAAATAVPAPKLAASPAGQSHDAYLRRLGGVKNLYTRLAARGRVLC